MRDASRSERISIPEIWRRLNGEQRAAGVGAIFLFVSTFGPFSFVEVAEMLLAIGVLLLLKSRAEAREFHLPFGDGTAIAAAGIWAGVLILIRLFDRPLGQGLLSLACAAVIALAGIRERAKRPADDLPDTQPQSDVATAVTEPNPTRRLDRTDPR
jgi:hypothetical protein